MQPPDYYAALHVQPDAPDAVIRASYRALMQKLRIHPDLGGDHAHAALVNEAFATLIDPERRAAYDAALARAATHVPRGGASESASESGSASQRHGTQGGQGTAPRPAASAHASTIGEALERGGHASCSFCGASASLAREPRPDTTCDECGSAMYPARRHDADGHARRALERLPRSMAVKLRSAHAPGVVASATSQDLSLNGMRFRTDAALDPGVHVRIDCAFCSAVAVVRSVQRAEKSAAAPFLCGVEFVTLNLRHARGGLLSVSV